MPSMMDMLPAGLAGYAAGQQATDQRDAHTIQQASTLQQIMAAVQRQKREEVQVQRNEQLRAAIQALPPEQRTRENVLPLLMQFGDVKEMIPLMKGKEEAGFSLAPEHTRYDGAGNAIVTAPSKTPIEKPSRQRYDGETVIQEERQPDGSWKEIGRGPRFAKTVEAPVKPPAGYRSKPDGSLEPIPGGPADTKLQGQYNADTAILQSSTSGLDRMAVSANELMKHPGLEGITGFRGSIPNIPGTAAADAQAKLETLKSQVGFSVLQAMRDASKTGGALGNVSDAEGKRLEANLAALQNAQSYGQFKTELQKILTFTDEAKDRLRAAYNLKHGDKPAGGSGAPKFSEGQTATGPNGEKIIYRGGKWVPNSQ